MNALDLEQLAQTADADTVAMAAAAPFVSSTEPDPLSMPYAQVTT